MKDKDEKIKEDEKILLEMVIERGKDDDGKRAYSSTFRCSATNLEEILAAIRACNATEQKLWDYFQKQSEEIDKEQRKKVKGEGS